MFAAEIGTRLVSVQKRAVQVAVPDRALCQIILKVTQPSAVPFATEQGERLMTEMLRFLTAP